jgi:hypothetical protein
MTDGTGTERTASEPHPADGAPDDGEPIDVPAAAQREPHRRQSAASSVTVAPANTGSVRTAAPGDPEILSSSDDGTSTRERSARERADWTHFAPHPPREVPRLPRTTGHAAIRIATVAATVAAPVRRFRRREWVLAVLGGLALSLLANRRALADPAHTLPQDVWDPSLVAYLIAWGGHALTHDPANVFHFNAFFPSPYGLAYTDSLLGYAPFAVIGVGPEAAVLRYNVIFILAQALAFVGAYALVRQLGIGRVGAAVAGVAIAMAPWRLGQAGHLHVISTGGIALALAMLARGHGVRWTRPRDGESRPPKRPGWALAGWLVAAWQLTIGFGIGLVFAYVLLACVVIGCLWWAVRRRPWPSRRMLVADGLGGLIFAAVALLMAQPYLKVLELYPYVKRTTAYVEIFSPPLRGYFTAPPESFIWGDAHASSRAQLSLPAEMDLLPGFSLYALAVAGLFFSVWTIWVRLALLAGVIASIGLGMGTRGPAEGRLGYVWLLDHLPGFEGLRTPGRFIVWTTLLLAMLAAGGVCALATRANDAAERLGRPRPTAAARAALLVPVALLILEGLGTTPHPRVPAAPPTLSTVEAPYLVLPTDQLPDMHVMLWSTDRFAPLVNGASGFIPLEMSQTRRQVASFPDAASVDYLRRLGVKTVVVLPDASGGTQWQNAATLPIDGLGITRELRPDAVVFRLS